MTVNIDLLQEIFAIDMLRAALKYSRKHVLRPLQLYGDQALLFVILRNNCNSKVMEISNFILKKKMNASFLDFRHQMQPEIY